jgi:hypothetical protein
LEILELKLRYRVLVAAFGSRSRGIKKQLYIIIYIGDGRFEQVFFIVSGQLIHSLLIGADFLPVYILAVNFNTNCLMYETEGNT